MGIEFESYIGSAIARLPELPCPVEDHVSLNTPRRKLSGLVWQRLACRYGTQPNTCL